MLRTAPLRIRCTNLQILVRSLGEARARGEDGSRDDRNGDRDSGQTSRNALRLLMMQMPLFFRGLNGPRALCAADIAKIFRRLPSPVSARSSPEKRRVIQGTLVIHRSTMRTRPKVEASSTTDRGQLGTKAAVPDRNSASTTFHTSRSPRESRSIFFFATSAGDPQSELPARGLGKTLRRNKNDFLRATEEDETLRRVDRLHARRIESRLVDRRATRSTGRTSDISWTSSLLPPPD